MPLSSAAISTYSIAGAVDFRSGAPIALDGSQNIGITAVNVTNGAFNGTSSYVQITGLSLSAVLGITIQANIPGQTDAVIAEYGASTGGEANTAVFYIPSPNDEKTYAQGAGTYTANSAAPCDISSGSHTLNLQCNIGVSPFISNFTIDGGVAEDGGGMPAEATGTFGSKTLNIGSRNAASLWLTGTIDFLIVHTAMQDAALVDALAGDIYAVLDAGGGTLASISGLVVADIASVNGIDTADLESFDGLTF